VAHVEKRTQIRRDGSKPIVVWRARYRGPHGREHSRTFRTKIAAQRWLATVETSKVTGEWIDPALGKIPCGDYIDSWLATKSDVAASTKLNIEGRINKHVRPFFAQMPVSAVRPAHARRFVADLVSAGLAPSTVKSITLTTSQVFAQAVDDLLIVRSPFAKIKIPADRNREEMHFLTAEQVNKLAAAIDDRYRVAIFLSAYGGLRAGELWALRVEKLNVLAGSVDVVASMSEAGGLHAGPTKTGKRRTIAIPRFLAQMLGEHIGRYPSPDGWVFTAGEGGPVHHHNFRNRHYVPATRIAKLPGVRFHDLRHTCAALLIAAGRHLEEVKTYLGHSSIRVTSDRYGHLFPEARAALADALDATYRSAPAASPRPELEIARGRNAYQRPRRTADLRVLRLTLERTTGFEPATPTLARLCSTS
jgi:integrase